MQLNPLQWSKYWSLMPTCNMASENYQRQCTSIIHWKTGLCDCVIHTFNNMVLGFAAQWNSCVQKRLIFSPHPFQSLLCERREDIKLRFLSSLHLIYLWLWMLHWHILVPLHKHCCSVAQSCLTFCNPMDCSKPGFPVLHHLLSLLKLMFIELVKPSNHLILCHPLILLPSIFPSIRVFSNKSGLHIRWPNYWSFSFCISSSNECSGLISFRIDWIDLCSPRDSEYRDSLKN